MKPTSNPKRFRGGRPNGRRHHQYGFPSNYESNGPDVKVRGNAAQVHDRYMTLSRDALASGDRIASENYMQHAEHYQRLLNAQTAAQNEANGARAPRDGGERQPRGGEDGERRPSRRARPRAAQEQPYGDGALDGGAPAETASL